MIIYSYDIICSAEKIALRRLANYEKQHPELAELSLDTTIDLRNNLLRKAFHPWAVAKLTARLTKRGHTIIDGTPPERRLTTQRNIDRFMRCLSNTIAVANDRMKKAMGE